MKTELKKHTSTSSSGPLEKDSLLGKRTKTQDTNDSTKDKSK